MKRLAIAAALCACLIAALVVGAQPSQSDAKPSLRAPKGFFGIDPQSVPTEEDARYMKAGGIETIRWPVAWSGIQPTRRGGYHWESLDEVVTVASRHGMKVLPILYGTPAWLAPKYTTLPVNNARARRAWTEFLEAAVRRYGPGGEFWAERAPGFVRYQPAVPRPQPIRSWQVWNEVNFFYFAYPVSPRNYVKLLKISTPAIKGIDPGAQVILSGLFGEPTAKGAKGMTAVKFLEAIYRTPGIKSLFDGIALHPYAYDSEKLEELVEELVEVTKANHDRVPLYITEMGWGSQNDYYHDAFEHGIAGQVKELKAAFGYLLENRARLDLKQVYWFAWKDLPGSCDFCDSVGLFRDSERFRPKPAWRAFTEISGGRLRP